MTTADALVSEPLRVLIADDHVLFRDGLRALLRSAPDTQLVGEATTGEEAIRLAAELQPDVILMDIRMPGMDGIMLCRTIRDEARTGYVYLILLTGQSDHDLKLAALDAGADDFLIKPFDRPELAGESGYGALPL